MDFKVGDIVRIRGGADEWEYLEPGYASSGTLRCKSIFCDYFTYFYPTYLELVRRPSDKTPKTGQENVGCDHVVLSSGLNICLRCGTQFPHKENKKVERWLWVMKSSFGYDVTRYLTEEEFIKMCNEYEWENLGRDPNCLKPLITEE